MRELLVARIWLCLKSSRGNATQKVVLKIWPYTARWNELLHQAARIEYDGAKHAIFLYQNSKGRIAPETWPNMFSAAVVPSGSKVNERNGAINPREMLNINFLYSDVSKQNNSKCLWPSFTSQESIPKVGSVINYTIVYFNINSTVNDIHYRNFPWHQKYSLHWTIIYCL